MNDIFISLYLYIFVFLYFYIFVFLYFVSNIFQIEEKRKKYELANLIFFRCVFYNFIL